MPGPSNILAARGFRLYKRTYNYKKVVSSGLNVEKIIPENTCQSPGALPQLYSAFKNFLKLTHKSVLTSRTPMAKTGQIGRCQRLEKLGDM